VTDNRPAAGAVRSAVAHLARLRDDLATDEWVDLYTSPSTTWSALFQGSEGIRSLMRMAPHDRWVGAHVQGAPRLGGEDSRVSATTVSVFVVAGPDALDVISAVTTYDEWLAGDGSEPVIAVRGVERLLPGSRARGVVERWGIGGQGVAEESAHALARNAAALLSRAARNHDLASARELVTPDFEVEVEERPARVGLSDWFDLSVPAGGLDFRSEPVVRWEGEQVVVDADVVTVSYDTLEPAALGRCLDRVVVAGDRARISSRRLTTLAAIG
jgi:hypothetical protein